MENYLFYLLKAAACIFIFYIVFLLFFKKDNGFQSIRLYILLSIFLSALIPLTSFSFSIPTLSISNENKQEIVQKTSSVDLNSQGKPSMTPVSNKLEKHVDYLKCISWLYILVLALILLRFVGAVSKIIYIYAKYPKEFCNQTLVLKNEEFPYSFSFFNLIFINPKDLSENEVHSIIAHENIHVSQYHTIDVVLIELLSAVMWFNPAVWLFRKKLRQVHEYLADEGVLNIGFDRLEYQTLLINQVAEGRLLSLTSQFNHSQIKNRIIMMTKINSGNRTKVKLLTLLPIAIVLILSMAYVNGQEKNNVVTAVEPIRMNVLYVGVDNPVKIASSGYESSQLEVFVDNGKISGQNGEYTINPEKQGEVKVIVKNHGEVIQESKFRAKLTPNPYAAVKLPSGRLVKSGTISRKELIEAGGFVVEMENFDFDMKFEVVEFSTSTVIDGFSYDRTSITSQFTPEQVNLLNSMKNPGQKLYIENIKAKGSDGIIRQLGTIVFSITDI